MLETQELKLTHRVFLFCIETSWNNVLWSLYFDLHLLAIMWNLLSPPTEKGYFQNSLLYMVK